MALMAVVCVAFLVYSSRQVSFSTQSSAVVLSSEAAGMAMRLLVEDLRTEMEAGSVQPDPNRVTPKLDQKVLYPAAPRSVLPDRFSVVQGSNQPPPNLVKQSAYGKKFFDADREDLYPRGKTFKPSSRASELSTSDPARPESSISAEKWNRPLLIPRQSTTTLSDTSPQTQGSTRFAGSDAASWQWTPPSWVYLQRSGRTDPALSASLGKATLNGSDPVVARFAYQIYDAGGLIDLNVAGYDPKLKNADGVKSDFMAIRKGSLGYAQLTELGFTADQISTLVSVRNPGTLSSKDLPPYRDRYANFLFLGRQNLGFLRPGGNAESGLPLPNAAIPSRLALIELVQKLAQSDQDRIKLLNSLQYLTHFSRGLEQPSYFPGFLQAGSDPVAATFVFPRVVPPASATDDGIPTDDTVYKIIGKSPGIPVDNGGGVYGVSIANWDLRARVGGRLPWELAIGNNRGGNDAWGKVGEKDVKRALTDTKRYYQDTVNPGFLEVRVPATLPSPPPPAE